MERSSLHPNLAQPEASRTESRLRLLIQTGLLLGSESDLDAMVQAALDAGLQLSDARFGAFFYNPPGQGHSPYGLYKLSGIDEKEFRGPVLPPTSAAVWQVLQGETPLRIDDYAALQPSPIPNASPNASPVPSTDASPAIPLLPVRTPLRSYLAVPVRNQAGQSLGALLYGHPEPHVFSQETEDLLTTLAAQAAVAIAHAVLRPSALEAAAKADAARLRHALGAAQLGTWNWDAATGLIEFDERGASLFGVQPHRPIARDDLRTRLVHGDDLQRTPADLKSLLETGGHYTAEYRVRTADGSVRWVGATGNATYSESGDAVGMIGTLQDITPRKQQEDTLRTSEKLAATGRLAATIAHEINNPLEAVTNLIYLAKTDPMTPASIARMLETADTELARVSQIAQQTLGFYRDTTRPISVDLNELLQAVVSLFDRKLTGKQLQCTLDLEPGLSIVGLQGEIRQVVSNLLVNAIDASQASGGRIHIRARHRRRDGGGGVSLLVSDLGSGIPQDVKARLFTPFVTTKESLGTGLGLWVTQGMVEKHGGSVRFRSRTEAPSGTVFRVYFPKSGSPQLFTQQSSLVLQ